MFQMTTGDNKRKKRTGATSRTQSENLKNRAKGLFMKVLVQLQICTDSWHNTKLSRYCVQEFKGEEGWSIMLLDF